MCERHISQFWKNKNKKRQKSKGRQVVNNAHTIKRRPSNGLNMANGSYRKELVANVSGWGDQSLLQMVC